MKKKETSDKSFLCFAGIFLCLLFIVLPPLFRKVFPKPVNIVVDSDYTQLSCYTEDNGERVIMNYKGEEKNIGQVKYTFVMDAESFRANLLKTDMERSYNLTKTPNEEDNTMMYVISPTEESSSNIIDSNDLLLLSIELKQMPQDKKGYYEKLGFTCSLTDL